MNATQATGGRSIGENLRRLREAAGLSQGELAIRARLRSGQPLLSQYELGKVTPTIGQLKLLAEGLGCTVADLVEGV